MGSFSQSSSDVSLRTFDSIFNFLWTNLQHMLQFEAAFWDLKLLPTTGRLHVFTQSLASLAQLPVQPHMMLEDLCRWTRAGLKRRANRKARMRRRGKSKTDSSFQKGKGKVKGKFSTSSTGKGKGKPATQSDKSNICLYCGKAGHWKRDLQKVQA